MNARVTLVLGLLLAVSCGMPLGHAVMRRESLGTIASGTSATFRVRCRGTMNLFTLAALEHEDSAEWPSFVRLQATGPVGKSLPAVTTVLSKFEKTNWDDPSPSVIINANDELVGAPHGRVVRVTVTVGATQGKPRRFAVIHHWESQHGE